MQARIQNPIALVPGILDAMMGVARANAGEHLPKAIRKLVHLRASQINGCGVCVDMHSKEMRHAGESEERVYGIAAWREMPYYTDAERAALALAEAGTRLADRSDAVSDEVWNEAARHFDEKALASLVIEIAQINAWNRLSVITRQIAGSFKPSANSNG